MSSDMKGIGILGTGSAVPDTVVTNKDIEAMGIDTTDEWIAARTGIRQRRIAYDDASTGDLSIKAARRVLEATGIDPLDIDSIIVSTTTPDHAFPSTACLVQAAIGADRANAFDVAAACTGFVYGLVTSAAYIKAGLSKYVLCIGADTLSKITDWQDRGTCILFGDAAGAILLGPVDGDRGILSTHLGAMGAMAQELIVPAGGSRKPATHETVENREHYIYMNGNEIFRFAVGAIPKVAKKNAEDAGLTVQDVDFFLFHQANLRILNSARKRLRVAPEKILTNLDQYGNTSAASIPLLLDEAVREDIIQEGHLLNMIGFGGGLTWGGVLLRY